MNKKSSMKLVLMAIIVFLAYDVFAVGSLQDQANQLISQVIANENNRDLDAQMALYGAKFTYNGNVMSWDKNREEAAAYYKRWPLAQWKLIKPVEVINHPESNMYETIYVAHYRVESPQRGKWSEGTLTSRLTITNSSTGPLIISARDKVSEASKGDLRSDESMISSAHSKTYNPSSELNLTNYSHLPDTNAAVKLAYDVFATSQPVVRHAKDALLIANADYLHFGKLPNPIIDARVLAEVLTQIGFNVSVIENASREEMLDALVDFENRLKISRGIAFFHYGGHGVQVDGKNFLIPTDVDIPDEKRVATRAVDLDEVMGALDASGSSVNVVVLDACRDNPLPATSTRSATRGLSVVAHKPKNSIIIYAAEAGNKAQDGLFTPALAKALAGSNRPISDVMTEVRREVYSKSGGTQTPGEYNQLFDNISLSSGAANSSIPPTNDSVNK